MRAVREVSNALRSVLRQELASVVYVLLAMLLGLSRFALVCALASAGHLWLDRFCVFWDVLVLYSSLDHWAAFLFVLWVTRTRVRAK
jgi:hypothetical protein